MNLNDVAKEIREIINNIDKESKAKVKDDDVNSQINYGESIINLDEYVSSLSNKKSVAK
jgi:hypothetical protein